MARQRGISKTLQEAAARAERVTAKALIKGAATGDSFQNFAARVGLGTRNISDGSTYGFNPITRQRLLLEWMHRGSWLIGKAIETPAEDMAKQGIEFIGDEDPMQMAKLHRAMRKHLILHRFTEAEKWARLYGGAIAVMLIEGQDPASPLRIETVGRNAFNGLMVLDRWMLEPSLNDLVTEQASPDLGLPRFYRTNMQAPALPKLTVHHTRVVRLLGIALPYNQMITENMWGMSVLERIFDRLVAFDSATQGASQLMYRAHIRAMKIEGLRKIIAAGGKAQEALVQQLDMTRMYQSTEGLTLLDTSDDMITQQYAFAGVGETILQFGQQISGAMDIPLVRLFGQSPAGLNSTGESDIKTYNEGMEQKQETRWRRPLDVVLRVIAKSEGVMLSDSWDFEFNPLSQLSEKEKADIAEVKTRTVLSAESSGTVTLHTTLKELRQMSRVLGVWTNITDEEIDAAKDVPLPKLDPNFGQPPQPGDDDPDGGGNPDDPADPADNVDHGAGGRTGAPALRPRPSLRVVAQDQDSAIESTTEPPAPLPERELHGLRLLIETPKGTRRSGHGWSVIMPADYGYIRRTSSAEGIDEGMDCFVGPNPESRAAYIIDQLRADTGEFDEHKVMLAFDSPAEAYACYQAAHTEADDTFGGMVEWSVDQLAEWLENGDVTAPLSGGQSPGNLDAAE
jgi:phage-related protein (TIGR01555 family)